MYCTVDANKFCKMLQFLVQHNKSFSRFNQNIKCIISVHKILCFKLWQERLQATCIPSKHATTLLSSTCCVIETGKLLHGRKKSLTWLSYSKKQQQKNFKDQQTKVLLCMFLCKKAATCFHLLHSMHTHSHTCMHGCPHHTFTTSKKHRLHVCSDTSVEQTCPD